jgi:hypothetical protein
VDVGVGFSFQPGSTVGMVPADSGDLPHARRMGLEGIVSKSIGSRYLSGRTRGHGLRSDGFWRRISGPFGEFAPYVGNADRTRRLPQVL